MDEKKEAYLDEKRTGATAYFLHVFVPVLGVRVYLREWGPLIVVAAPGTLIPLFIIVGAANSPLFVGGYGLLEIIWEKLSIPLLLWVVLPLIVWVYDLVTLSGRVAGYNSKLRAEIFGGSAGGGKGEGFDDPDDHAAVHPAP